MNIAKKEYNLPEDLEPTPQPSAEIERELERGAEKNIVPPGLLAGNWVNVNPTTRNIVRLSIGGVPGATTVHLFGACVPTPCDWGVAKGFSYSTDVSSPRAVAFSAGYGFGFKDTVVVGHVQGAFLVVELFNHFKDASGRFDYYTSEMFRRA